MALVCRGVPWSRPFLRCPVGAAELTVADAHCGASAWAVGAKSTFGWAMKKRVVLYLRVSTKGQSVENQRRELEAVAAHRGWAVVAVYQDAGINGAKGRDKRPGFDRLLKDATRRQFDLIGAWSVDRLGRSLQDLVASLGELHAVGAISICINKRSIPRRRPAKRCSR